jgi:hypothetical protein
MSYDYFGFKNTALGNLCLSIDEASIGGRPCHPARMAERNDERRVGSVLEWGLGSERKTTAKKILNGEIDGKLIADLFREEEPVIYSGGFELYYLQTPWSLTVSPYKVWYYSHSRNRATPLIDLHLLEQKDVQLQMGSAIGNHTLIGLNIKYLSRRFFHNSVSLFEALVDNDVLKHSEQNVLLLEPGIIWTGIDDSRIKPELSLLVSNLGLQDKKFEGFSIDPTLHLGGSLNVIEKEWHCRIGLQTETQNPREKHPNTELWRAGTIVGNDWAELTYSANKTEQSFGVLSKSKYFYSGLIYEKKPERVNFNFGLDF